MKKLLVPLLAASCLNLTACSTISDWFADDEELEIKKLEPIQSQFTATEVWEQSMGNGVRHYFSRLKPAVGYAMVFAANRQGKVAAFEQVSGKKVWEKDFAIYSDEGFFSGVTRLWSSGVSAKLAGGMSVAYETLYFGSENGDVYALNAKTGETKWHKSVRGEILAAPAIDAGVLVVSTTSGLLVALDAETGEQLWTYESEVPPLSLRGVSAAVAAAGGAIVGTATGKLVVNILESGQTAWEQPITAPSGATELDRIVDIDSRPLVSGSQVYVISNDGTLASVELRSGRIIWKREYKSYRRLTQAGANLFLVDNDSNVYGLDIRNGVELWSQTGLKRRQLTAAEPIGDYLVVGDKFGFLHWLNQSDGQIVSRLEVGGDDEDEAIYSSPVVDGNMLYTQTRDGKLVAISIPQ